MKRLLRLAWDLFLDCLAGVGQVKQDQSGVNSDWLEDGKVQNPHSGLILWDDPDNG